MDAKVTWSSGLSFTGTADSGFMIPLDGLKAVGGQDGGFRPMELFTIGLAGCTAMDVISITAKMRQEVTNFEVKVHADRKSEHPKIFTEIMIEYIVTGVNLDPEAIKKAVLLSQEKYCPAQAILSKSAQINHKITLIEA